MKANLESLLAALILLAGHTQATAQGTAFTYQGRLMDAGAPANGNYDLTFTLFSVSSGGSAIAGPLTNSSVGIANGLFTATLDFGSSAFPGAARWLEIGVRTNAASAFTTLTPRQSVAPTPYAIFANSAANASTAASASAVAAGSITSASLADGSVTAAKISSGQVVKSLNGLTDGVSLAAGANMTLSTNGNILTLSGPAGGNGSSGWSLTGNAGTTAGANFVGTTDNQPLEFRVSAARALRLEPNTNGAPNLIAGSPLNQVAPDVVGATIGGGGAINYLGAASSNHVAANFSTLGGGIGNTINTNADFSILGGGENNLVDADSDHATIAGGGGNYIDVGSDHATIAGGDGNYVGASCDHATIGGGDGNTIRANSDHATVAGGTNNFILAGSGSAAIGGGFGNTIGTNAANAAIPGGFQNTATGKNSLAAGSRANAIHTGAFVWSDSSSDASFASSGANTFSARCTGGAQFVTGVIGNGIPNAGVSLAAGSGAWSSLSDRQAKQHFTPVNAREVLDAVAALPIATWSYKTQPASVRHIGPMAQDFAAAFRVGEDDRHITTVDADGVALAAIQGLNQKLEAQLKERDGELQALRQRLAALERILNAQSTQPPKAP